VVTRIPDHIRRSVLANALFLVDKPPEWTSGECVRAMKWALKIDTLGHRCEDLALPQQLRLAPVPHGVTADIHM
jgi:hypothetical protein